MSEYAPGDSEAGKEFVRRASIKVQVMVALFGLILLWSAVQFGREGNWPVAAICLLAFVAIEAFAFIAIPYMSGRRKLPR